MRIYVEGADDLAVATPKALAEIERQKNSYILHHNIPPSKDIDSHVTVDKRTTLGELKTILAEVRNCRAFLFFFFF